MPAQSAALVEGYRRYRRNRRPEFAAPGPRGMPLIGSTAAFQPDPITFLKRVAEDYGTVARFRILFDEWYMLNDPALVRQVLVKDWRKYHKPRINKQIFKDFMGNGLVSSDGEHHARQHKLIKTAFHRRRIMGFAPTIVDYTQAMIDRWQEGETVDMGAELTGLTLRVIVKTMLGADMKGETQRVREAMETVNEVLVDHINLPLPVPHWWPSKTNRRKIRAIRDVEEVLFEIVAKRRASGVDGGDLLSRLVLARDEDGRGMTDLELRDEGMTLFFAGHETASHSMTWLWWLLAEHPEVVSTLDAELEEVLGGAPPTFEDLKKLPYLEMVVKEGLRLFGAAWTFMREPIEDVQLGNTTIPRGAYIVISPHILHRRPELFEDPEAFRPERFTPANQAKLPLGAYVPFSMGPRVCLGKSLAMVEMRLIIATLMQRIRPQLVPGFVPELQAQISLHPANGMPNVVRFRD